VFAGLMLVGCFGWPKLFAQTPDPNDRRPPLQMASYDWEKDAAGRKLSVNDINTLKTQGLVVTGETSRQVFFPYLDQTQLFITSDCVANAYSILLEESIRLLEKSNARNLNAFLSAAWKELAGIESKHTGDKALLHAAAMRIRIMMGVAFELSSGEKVQAAPELAKTIEDEVQRVIAATGQSKPAWLGPPDEGFEAIDYTRFKPRGIYADNPALERYFRATAWLQAIPFRLDRDDEFAALLLLYVEMDDRQDKEFADSAQQVHSMVKSLDSLVGEADGWGLLGMDTGDWPDKPWTPQFLADIRQLLLTDLPKDGQEQINDQYAIRGKDAKPEPSFRLLAAHRVPDAVLFSKTEQLRQGAMPSGLDVAVALGSPVARKIYEKNHADLLKEIDADKDMFGQGSIYSLYLNVMATLLQPVDSAAPPLFHQPAWEEKSLETFLGGWAQDRHAWILQAKQNVEMMGGIDAVPSGFVEPVPDFFNKMGQLSLESRDIFQRAGAYDYNLQETADELRNMATAFQHFAVLRKHDPKARPSESDMLVMESADSWMMYFSENGSGYGMSGDDMATQLDKLALRLETTGPGNDKHLREMLTEVDPSPEENWVQLTQLCLELEALAQKQLRGLPLSQDDDYFYQGFGERLAHLMFYGGNTYENARDNAPRIADVDTDPNTGQVLHIGIGRPRTIYVLYPYGGKQILTHGAVLPYYEFPSTERLTDKEWADLLSSPTAPAQPKWLDQLSGPR
jgi:hypothetical protein